MEKLIKSNPENLIRELLTSKYNTLDNACKILELGSSQGLNNNLKRWSNQEGTFKAFYKIISKLQYKIEYHAFPILPSEFDYEKFSKLLDDGKFAQASRLIDFAYNSENQSIYTAEYAVLRNQLENRKSYVENKYRIITTFSEKQLNFIIKTNKSFEFTKNLELIVDGYSKIKDIFEDIENIIEISNVDNKEEIQKKFRDGFFGTIGHEENYFVEKVFVDDEAVWVKLKNGKMYDITYFFEKNSLLKFKVRKNQTKLKIEYLNITDNTNTINMVNCIYDGNPFLGKYNYMTKELKKVNF
ncbi:hypothetical protein NRK67_01650 [Fusobacteria bacterium ZRK30]|nr:hypothetical protein NRK67_01650 [Fusobacteria bacterium ZRK30]